MPRQDESQNEAKERLHQQFESATESQFDNPRPEKPDLDDRAVNGPGGDSRPDLVDPSTAQFHNATFDPELATTRENLPEVTRGDFGESRKPEYSGIVGHPTGPEFSQERAVVDDQTHHEGIEEILDREREHGGETGGMGRANVPKDNDVSQGTWHDDPDSVTDDVPS